MADAATVVAVVAATDYSWLPPTILAAAAFVGSIASLIVSIRTGKAVDGKMTQLLEVSTGRATAEAIIGEKKAEANRQGATALATQEHADKLAAAKLAEDKDIKGKVELTGVVK